MATQNRGGKGPRAGARPASPAGASRGGPTNGGGAGAPRRLGQQSNAPRRLGQQPASRPQSGGAQRRAQRARQSSRSRWGWLSIPVVVVVVLVFVLVKVTSGGSPAAASSAGRNPSVISSSLLDQYLSTPMSTQSAAGIGTQTTSPFAEIADYKALEGTVSGGPGGTSKTVPRVAFVGAEFCPYCAVDRYAVVLALSRLGTFHNLKAISSAADDGDIPTFSFLNSSYTSKWLTFTPYEDEDRDHNSLDPPPSAITDLWETQDSVLSGGSVGYPYINFGGKYVLASFPTGLDNTLEALEGSNGTGIGMTQAQIIAGISHPSSSYASIIDGSAVLAQANFIDATICSLNGGKGPASVCQAAGVKAALAVIDKAKPTKA